jgi:hypothetical protein
VPIHRPTNPIATTTPQLAQFVKRMIQGRKTLVIAFDEVRNLVLKSRYPRRSFPKLSFQLAGFALRLTESFWAPVSVGCKVIRRGSTRALRVRHEFHTLRPDCGIGMGHVAPGMLAGSRTAFPGGPFLARLRHLASRLEGTVGRHLSDCDDAPSGSHGRF